MFFILTVNLSFSDWTAKVKSPSSRFTVPVSPEPTTVPVNVEFEVLRPTGVTSVVKNPVSLKLKLYFLRYLLPVKIVVRIEIQIHIAHL